MEYARISHVISTALHNGDARPCHKQARAVLDTHRDCSAKRRRAITPLPEARAHYRYRALALILHPDRTAPELLRHRTMARLAWDAVQTARAYLEHTGQVDELFPLEQRRPPTTPFTGLWLPVPRADSAAFLTALHHTPANLVPTGPRRLPNRLVRTTSLSLARPAPAMDRGTPNASSPVTNPSPIIMSRSHSLPSRVPPAWHATPVILDFSQCDHDDLHVAEGQTPGEPQCRPLLLNPDTRTAPLLQHNLDLVLNDSDARFIASRHATTAAPIVGVDTRTDPPTDLESLAGSDDDYFDDDDGHMSADNGDADSSHRTGTCARPHVTHSHHGDATQQPPVAARPARPASPLAIHGTQLLDSAEPFSPVPHMFSATDTFPDDTQTRLQPQPAEDWCFSDAEDGVSSDDSTPGLFTPPASVGDAQPVPTRTVATAAGRPSAFFLHTHCDPAPAAGSHRRVRDGGGSESHFSHPPYDTAPTADSHRGARADDESESRLLHAGGESETHLSHTHYELAPHLLHPRHDPVPTADSHRGARVGGASESNLLHTRYDPAFAVAAAAARPPSAVFLRTRYDPAPDTDSHQGARTGGASESHFSTTPSLTTADPSATAASAATTFVASSSPDATEGSADHFSAPAPPAAENTTTTDASTTETPTSPPPPPFYVHEGAKDGALAASSSPGVALGATDGATAAAASSCLDVAVGTNADGPTADVASAADDDMGVDTGPVPAVTAPPNAGHISSFLLHIRRRADDTDVHPAATTDRPAITHDGVVDDMMAVQHGAGERRRDVAVADDAQASGASVADAGMAVEAVPPRKRRGTRAHRGRDGEYYRRKWLRKAEDPSAPQDGPTTPPHGGGGART